MSLQGIMAALDAQLATLSGLDTSKVAWLNTAYVPEANTAYLATSLPAITRTPITIGAAGEVEWRGTYQVRCNWPAGTGVGDAAAQVDSILALFPRGLTLTTSDGLQLIFDTPTPRPFAIDGEWLYGVAQMPWFAYEVVT